MTQMWQKNVFLKTKFVAFKKPKNLKSSNLKFQNHLFTLQFKLHIAFILMGFVEFCYNLLKTMSQETH